MRNNLKIIEQHPSCCLFIFESTKSLRARPPPHPLGKRTEKLYWTPTCHEKACTIRPSVTKPLRNWISKPIGKYNRCPKRYGSYALVNSTSLPRLTRLCTLQNASSSPTSSGMIIYLFVSPSFSVWAYDMSTLEWQGLSCGAQALCFSLQY